MKKFSKWYIYNNMFGWVGIYLSLWTTYLVIYNTFNETLLVAIIFNLMGALYNLYMQEYYEGVELNE